MTSFHDHALADRGWRAQLHGEFVQAAGRTRLTSRRHYGPLVVQRPFYPEGEVCHVYLVHPPGGVAGGDQLGLEMTVHAGAHALITTPAATKFYKSGGRLAAQSQRFAARNGILEWLPQENIFFADAAVRLDTIVHLSGEARFIGWEMACYGRPASGESLQQGKILQSFELWKDDVPLLLDRLKVDGSGEMMRAHWGLANNAVLGTLLAYPFLETDLAELREIAMGDGLLDPSPRREPEFSATRWTPAFAGVTSGTDDGSGIFLGCTLVDGVLVCRAMAHDTAAVKQAFIRIWQYLRPKVLNRPAVLPRIWAT